MPGILVVEDDENLNRGITFSLKKSGYEVFSAESVKKAKRIASDNNMDVAICDVNLPDGNGLELVRWMRNCQNVYIICLTALDQETDQVMGYEAGADDYDHYPKHNFYSPSHIGANRCKPFASACRVLLSLAWTQSCAEKSKSSSASGRCRCTDYLVCTHVRSGCYSV